MTTKKRKRAVKRPLRLKRPRRAAGTQTASVSRAAPVTRSLTAAASAPTPRAATPTIELETAFADDSLEMDASGQKFRVSIGLQNAIAALATTQWPPINAHPDNEEWNGTPNALPPGWGFWGLGGMLIYQGGVLTAGTGGPPQFGNIDPFMRVNDPGGTDVTAHRLDINSKRPSHCYWQPMAAPNGSVPEAGRWALMRKFTQPVGTDAFFLMNYVEATQYMVGTYAAADGQINFMLCGDDAGRPTLANCIIFGFRRKMGTAGPGWRVSGPNGSNECNSWMLYGAQPYDPYLVPGYNFLGIEKRGSFWRFYIFDERGNARFDSVGTFYQSYAFTPAWWGININACAGASPAHMYGGCNFLRRWDTKFPFI